MAIAFPTSELDASRARLTRDPLRIRAIGAGTTGYVILAAENSPGAADAVAHPFARID